MNLQRYCFSKDNDGHTYLLKAEELEDFGRLLDASQDADENPQAAKAEAEFIRRFDAKRIGGSVEGWTFTNPQEHT